MTRKLPVLRPQDATALEQAVMRNVLHARRDPVWFAKNVLQLRRLEGEKSLDEDPDHSWELDAWQQQMLVAVGDVARRYHGLGAKVNLLANIISVAACQGPGKTFGAAMVMHWFGFCFQGLQVCTAPKLQQVTTRLFREFEKIRRRAIPGYAEMMQPASTKITWFNDSRWYAIAETGATPESLQGFHDRYLLVIVDEASGVDENMFAVMHGTMSAGALVIGLLIGNPTQNVGTFADSHRRADLKNDYYRMQVSFRNSKRVKPKWVDLMRRQYTEQSPVYKVRCLGEFATTNKWQLIAPEWVVAARSREWSKNTLRPKLRISCDVADGGDDDTVITVAQHADGRMRVRRQLRYNFESSISPIRVAQECARLFVEYKGDAALGDDIVVDSLGVGAGTAGWLMDEQYPVIAYKGGETKGVHERYRNRRVQSYLSLRNDFRDGLIVLDDDMLDNPDGSNNWADFEAQLYSIRTIPGADKVEDLVTKEDLKKDGIKSPDHADSLAMQKATQVPRLSMQAQRQASVPADDDGTSYNIPSSLPAELRV